MPYDVNGFVDSCVFVFGQVSVYLDLLERVYLPNKAGEGYK